MSETTGWAGGFITGIGLEMERVEVGVAVCTLRVTEAVRSPIGLVHGGAIAGLIDTAMGAAAFSLLEPGQLCVTVEFKVSYMGNVQDGSLSCEARVLSRGGRLAFTEASVTDLTGRLLAHGTGSFRILSRAGVCKEEGSPPSSSDTQ